MECFFFTLLFQKYLLLEKLLSQEAVSVEQRDVVARAKDEQRGHRADCPLTKQETTRLKTSARPQLVLYFSRVVRSCFSPTHLSLWLQLKT